MSTTRTASKRNRTGSGRRRGRGTMAVDTRRPHTRRRELVTVDAHDWHDWLIPSGVVGFLASIMLYHHATLIDMAHAWL